MRASLIFFALLLAALGVAAQPAEEPSLLAFVNATLIDGNGSEPKPNATIIVEGETIAAISFGSDHDIPPDAEVRDLTGRFVIPGLIDSHVHIANGGAPRRAREVVYRLLDRMLYSGIVAVRNMFDDYRLIAEPARDSLVGDSPGPDVYAAAMMAGPQFLASRWPHLHEGFEPGEVPWAQAVTSETDVKIVVARAAGTGASGIKIYAQVNAELVRAIVDEAHRQGLKVWTHAVVFPDRPIALVRAGVDSLSHGCMLVAEDPNLDEYRRAGDPFTPFPEGITIEPSRPHFTELFGEMARRGTVLDTTTSVPFAPDFGCTPEMNIGIARAAARAGVILAAGSDYNTDLSEPYPALHRELEYLVDNEILTPLEAITAATLNGARAIGITETHGTLEPGKLANMVILRESPARNIRALRSVDAVLKRGVLYDRSEHDAR